MNQLRSHFVGLVSALLCACAQTPQVVAGIDNDAQFCELTMAQLRLYCAYMERRAAGQPPGDGLGYVCVDGISTSQRVQPADVCAAFLWSSCEALEPNAPCGIPVGPRAACAGAEAELCASGIDTFPEGGWEPGTGCNVRGGPDDCVIDRSVAYR